MTAFVENNCVIEHEGKEFEAGGAFLAPCSDGYVRGVVYANPVKGTDRCDPFGTVTDWHGRFLAKANFGAVYRGNFCRMRSVSFVYAGIRFTGRYCPDWADAIKVRSTKRVAHA